MAGDVSAGAGGKARSARKKTAKSKARAARKPVSAPKPERGPGQPSKYDPRYCAELIAFMAEGGTPIYQTVVVKGARGEEGKAIRVERGKLPAYFERFAHKIGVTHATLLNWYKDHEEFFEAYKKAKEIQLTDMVNNTLSGVYESAPAIFALKNMHGWRDKTEVEHSGRIERELGPETLEHLEACWDKLSLRQPEPGAALIVPRETSRARRN